MNVLRYDAVTVEETPQTLFTVPANEAYTVVGFTIVETEGESGEISLNISKQVNNETVNHTIGEFGISGNDTIYPISNVNMVEGESLKVECSISGVFVTASVVSREV